MRILRTMGRRLRSAAPRMARSLRRLLLLAVILAALLLMVTGVALVFLPAGLIAAGVSLLAIVTFDPTAAGRLTWPR